MWDFNVNYVLITDLINAQKRDRNHYFEKIIGGLEIKEQSQLVYEINAFYQGYIAYSKEYVVHVASNLMLKTFNDKNSKIETAMAEVLK